MIAIDTNVLLYACDRRDPARQAIAAGIVRNTAGGVLLRQVACEFISASRKPLPQGFSTTAAWDWLGLVVRAFPLVLPSPRVLVRSRQLHEVQRVSFWDATIIASCAEAGVERLYSEDVPGSVVAGLEVVNPFLPGS